jgi:undecaprenyl-phosphate 4-deoxy-4-formamido-L-arabinose transferase
MINISIVIPVYNSEDNLFELNNQIQKQLKKINFELILVNDQSKDNSWKIINNLTKENPNIIGINLRKNSGQDNAIFAGINYAQGEYIVIMDDDLQHSPSDILKLYEEIKKGYDVCYANFENKKQVLWKNIGSWLNGKIAEIIINKPKEIYLSPFKIIKKDIIDEVKLTNYLYPYIDGIIFLITNNITQIDAKHYDRFSGTSNYTLLESIKVFMKLATGFSVFPLRVASFVGALTSVFGFILGLYFILDYFINSSSPEGWTSMIVIVLFLGGIILMSLGIVGEYLGRIYLSINKKKSYTIKKELNNEQ